MGNLCCCREECDGENEPLINAKQNRAIDGLRQKIRDLEAECHRLRTLQNTSSDNENKTNDKVQSLEAENIRISEENRNLRQQVFLAEQDLKNLETKEKYKRVWEEETLMYTRRNRKIDDLWKKIIDLDAECLRLRRLLDTSRDNENKTENKVQSLAAENTRISEANRNLRIQVYTAGEDLKNLETETERMAQVGEEMEKKINSLQTEKSKLLTMLEFLSK